MPLASPPSWTGVLMKRLPCPKPRPKRSGATLGLSAFALLAPLHEIEKEPFALLLAARHPQTAAYQKLVELTARTQRLPVARQPVFRRLEASPAGKRCSKARLARVGVGRGRRESMR